jgi:hypothetical protein
MRKIIERYPGEPDLRFEERVNLMLMCDFAQELISQRIIDERLIRYIVAKDILKRNRRNKTL